MKGKNIIACVTLMAMILMFSAVVAYAGPAKQKVFRWRMQAVIVPGSVCYKAVEVALKNLKEATGGRLDIKVFGPGTLVGPFEQLDAVGKGLFEMSFDCPAFNAGKDPAFPAIFNLPVWPGDTTEVKTWLYYFGGNELAQELYGKYNVHCIGPAMLSGEPIMSRVPIRKLEDFKGLKIRTTLGLTSELFGRVGASPVSLSMGDIYTALDTGVVDAAECITLADNWDLGLHEVSKYVLFPSFHSPVDIDFVLVNKKAWDSLPPDLQAMLKMWIFEMGARFDFRSNAESLTRLKDMTDRGLVHTQLSAADMKKAQTIAKEVALEWGEKSPMATKIVDSIVNYLKLTGSLE